MTKFLGKEVLTRGASQAVTDELGIPALWSERCEDSFHTGYDGHVESLVRRLEQLQHGRGLPNYQQKLNNWVSMVGETTSANAKVSTS